jgi:kumamolisin
MMPHRLHAKAFMSGKNHFWGVRIGIIALFLAASLSSARATAPASVVLPGSTAPVDASPPTGTATPHRAYVSRQTLTSAENAAPLDFEVALKMRNFSELQARVSRGEHISPAEMAAKYEPTAADYQSVLDWAKSEGFTVIRQDPHHMALFVRGKISRIAQALKVNFSRVTFEGKEYSSAVTAPSVPVTISPLLMGINGLQPHLRAHKHLIKQQLQPNATGGSATYIPSQIAQAYNATGLYSSNITGGGQTIAIVIDTFPSTTDLLTFWKNSGVSQSISNIEFVQVVAGALAAPSGEETLDVEWASSMAPGAHVRVYAALDLANNDLDQAYQQVYDDVTNHPEYGIHQMSMSYGEGETYTTQSQVNTDDQYFAELAAAGVTIFASSGDGGATPGPKGGGDKTGPVQVESPASDPNVTGVGGTTLQLDSNNNTASEVVWNNASGASGGGTSIYFSRPTWQTGTGVPAGTMREVPDVAASADPVFGAIIYLGGVQTIEGGTSWSSPIWAGLCALMNQARANVGLAPLGILGPSIYPLLGTANYSANIRDIISGNNSMNGDINFSAHTGYDLATGIGAPLTAALAHTLVGSSTLIGVQMPPVMVFATPSEVTTFSVAVSGSSASYQWQRKAAGNSTWPDLSDNGNFSGSTTASLTVVNPTMAMNGDQYRCQMTLAGNVVMTSTPSVLVVATPLIISTLAGAAGTAALKDGTGTGANFNYPSGVAVDASGNLYIADFNNNVIRKVTPFGVVTTPYGSLAGTAGSANGIGNAAGFDTPNGVAIDNSGILYIADTGNNLVRKIVSGSVSTMAGSGGQFSSPGGIAVDSFSNVYLADTGNDVIRKITPSGTVSTLAGQVGTSGYADGNGLTQALFNAPSGVAVDNAGNVYVTDFGNNVIRKIDTSPSHTVTTFAGQGTISGFRDGPGATALFNAPVGIAIDGSNNLYVTDALVPPLGSNAAGNNLVRIVTPSGVVSTIAGNPGKEGTANGTGTAAQFYSLQSLALNGTGSVYLMDTYNQTIRLGIPQPAPTITVVATQPNAQVFGATPGQFTVTRTGATTNGFTVNYSMAGTAVPGTDYTALSGAITIPAGASSSVITVNPHSDPAAATVLTAQLSLTPSVAYNVGNPGSATVTIQQMTPYQTWKTNEFGANATDPTIAGETADPNHNGVPNLLEYAFNSNPLQGGTEPLPVISFVQDGNGLNYLAITYTVINTDPNLTCTVQVTSDLTQQTDQWNSGPAYTTILSQTVNGNTTQYTVRDNTPFSAGVNRFIRLQVGGM